MSLWSKTVASPLFHRGGIYLGSSFLSQGVMFLAWLLLPWKLSAEEIGQFALISFVIELLTRVTLMGMDSAMLRFYVDESRRPRVLASAGAWLAIGGGLAAILLVLAWNIVPVVFPALGAVYHGLAGLVLAVALMSALANIVLVHYVASTAAGQFGKLTTLRSILLAVGYLAGAWAGLGLRGLLISQFVAALVVVLLFGFTVPSDFKRLRADRVCLGELGTYGSPMLFYGMFALISDYSSRLILESQVTLATIGIFQFYYQIATQINGVWASINRAWTPHVFKHMATNAPATYISITRFSFWGTLSCASGIIVIMVLGLTGIWSAVIPPAYIAQIDLFYLLLLGPLFCCIYTAIYPAFYFEKNTLKISLIQSGVSLLTILLTIYCTIKYKSEGAALSWVLGNFCTPWIYVSCFPRLRSQLGASLGILLCWGVAGGFMTFALLQLHSPSWAVAALLVGASAVAFFGSRTLAPELTAAP